MVRVWFRRSALRSSWWSCPISGPRPCTWQKSSVRASGGRNWDVCLTTYHMITCSTLSPADAQPLNYVFLSSFIQHAWHRQRWDDNPRGIQTCKPLLASMAKKMFLKKNVQTLVIIWKLKITTISTHSLGNYCESPWVYREGFAVIYVCFHQHHLIIFWIFWIFWILKVIEHADSIRVRHLISSSLLRWDIWVL